MYAHIYAGLCCSLAARAYHYTGLEFILYFDSVILLAELMAMEEEVVLIFVP